MSDLSRCPGCRNYRSGFERCECAVLGCAGGWLCKWCRAGHAYLAKSVTEAMNSAETERVDGRRWKILRDFNDAAKDLDPRYRDAFGPMFATAAKNQDFKTELRAAFKKVGDLSRFAAKLRTHREISRIMDEKFSSTERLLAVRKLLGIDTGDLHV